MAETKNRLFSDADLKALIIPLVLEQALSVLVGMIDTMMISSAGEAAVSGVSLVDMINVLVLSVLTAMATGGCVVVSQYLGAREPEKGREAASQLTLTALVLGLVLMGIVFLFCRPILKLLFGSIENDVMQNAVIYFLITAVSYPFLGIYQACAALFRSMGNAKITFTTSVIVNAFNVTGNAIGVFVLKLGVVGVAVPTMLSRAVGAGILFVLLMRKREGQVIRLSARVPRPNGQMIRRILKIGVPNGLENGIFQIGRLIVVSIISMFGTVQIAANGVANSIDYLGLVGGQAMGMAVITVIGRCVGAKDEEQVRYYLKKMLIISYLLFLINDLPILILLKPLLSLYGLQTQTTQLAAVLIIIHAIGAILIWTPAFVLPFMLRACNDVKFPMVVSIASMFCFRIGFSYVLGVWLGWGAVGVWTAMILDWICRVICFVLRYRSGKWRQTAGLTSPGGSGA